MSSPYWSSKLKPLLRCARCWHLPGHQTIATSQTKTSDMQSGHRLVLALFCSYTLSTVAAKRCVPAHYNTNASRYANSRLSLRWPFRCHVQVCTNTQPVCLYLPCASECARIKYGLIRTRPDPRNMTQSCRAESRGSSTCIWCPTHTTTAAG